MSTRSISILIGWKNLKSNRVDFLFSINTKIVWQSYMRLKGVKFASKFFKNKDLLLPADAVHYYF